MKSRPASIGIIVSLLAFAAFFAQAETYTITEFNYRIQGITWPFALERTLELKKGMIFTSREELEAYVADRRQVLINQRIFEREGADITYSLKEKESGSFDVTFEINAKDTWNIIALPYFRIDSNSGVLLSARGRDYNFLGSMQTLRLNTDYRNDWTNNWIGEDVSFSLPFKYLGYDWSWTFGESFYIKDTGTEFSLSTSAAMTFPIFGQDWTLSVGQSYYVKDRLDPDVMFLTNSLGFSSGIKTPVYLGPLGQMSYNPGVSVGNNWWPGREMRPDTVQGVGIDRRGPYGSFSHSLSAGRTDWKENLREGMSASVSNSYSYNFFSKGFSKNVSASATFFTTFFSLFGIASRLGTFYEFDGENLSAGGSLRGIIDDRIHAGSGLYLNLDLPIVIWKSWIDFKFFDFELQANPFFDWGLFFHGGMPAEQARDIWYSGGLELFVFPKFARSIFIRAGIGFDLEAIMLDGKIRGDAPQDGRTRYEYFFGLGHFY